MVEGVFYAVVFPSITFVHSLVLLSALLRDPGLCASGLSRMYGRLPRSSSGGPHETVDDRQQRLLTERLEDLRVQALSDFIFVCLQVSGSLAAFVAVRLVVGLPSLGTETEAAILGSMYMVCLLLHLYPWLVNKNTLWILFHILEAPVMSLGVYYAVTDPTLFAYYYALMVLYRVSLSIAYPVLSSCGRTNVAWGLLSTFAFLQADGHDDSQICSTIGKELIAFFFQSYLAWKVGLFQTSQIRSDLKATGYLNSKRTMETLLADRFDAVVELGPDLRIKEPCPRLASLLIRNNAAQELQGDPFANHSFGEKDRERFGDYVTSRVPVGRDDDTDPASSMYLNLRDAYGFPVPVQLFHACQGTLDEACHILCVHEVDLETVAEEARDALRQTVRIADDATAPVGPANVHDVTVGVDGIVVAASPLGTVSASSSYDSDLVLAPTLPSRPQMAPLSLLFNPVSMEILAVTTDMRSVTGPVLYGGSLEGWISNFAEFCAWVKLEVNEFLNEDLCGREPVKFWLKMELSTLRQTARLEYGADAIIVESRMDARVSELGVKQPEGWADECHPILCLLELRNVQPRWRQAKSTPSRPDEDFQELPTQSTLDEIVAPSFSTLGENSGMPPSQSSHSVCL